MKLGIFLLILILATGIGVLLRQDPGYALFSYGNWTVEMPLWLAFIILLLTVMISLFGYVFINMIFSTIRRIKTWWYRRKQDNARLKTAQGLLELAEGRWQKAERYLINSANLSDTPVINYLSAAKAAEEEGSSERRDHYLRLAFNSSEGSDIAVRLTQAQLQFKHGQWEQSVNNLRELHERAPKHPHVLKLLCTLYEALGDYKSLFTLLPAIQKGKILKPEVLKNLEIKIYRALLPTMAEHGVGQVIYFWQSAPRAIQMNIELLSCYVEILIQQSAYEEAENVLRAALKKDLNDELIYLYGVVNAKPKKQLSFAESLYSKGPDNPALLLTLGRLCYRNQLWGKARDYLEQSVLLHPVPEAYQELGSVYDQLGKTAERDECYKKGLFCAPNRFK